MVFQIISLRYWPDVIKPQLRAWIDEDRKLNRPIPQHEVDEWEKVFGKRKRKKGDK